MRIWVAVSSIVLGLAVGAPMAGSDTAPPKPSGNWGGVGGTRISWADRLHAWRLAGRRNQQGFWPRIEATEDGGKRWLTVFRAPRGQQVNGVLWMNRLSRRVGVAVVQVGDDQRVSLTLDNGQHWRPVQGGRRWFLFEGDARALYLAPRGSEERYSTTLYRLAPWPSTRPRYIQVFDAPEQIVSLRKAPSGIVALLESRRYDYSVAVHRGGRTEVFEVPTSGLDATPHTCEAFRFTVQWPVLSIETPSGHACHEYSVVHVSRDGGRTWTASRG